MLHCLALLLQVHAAPEDPLPNLALRRAHLPLRHGGLGLRSAAAHAPAAYFASWADSLRAIRTRESVFCEDLLQQLAGPACNRRCLAWLQGATVVLTNHGLSVPVWGELVTEPPAEAEADPALHEPADLARGWQRAASKVVDDALLADLTSALDEASTALLHSQAGPFAGRVYTALPTCPELRLDSAAFRVLLLRRLRLPLPLDAAACRCGAHLDPFGDHRPACPRAGLLRGRGIPLERAAARVCREAGATVAANVLLRDLNIITRQHDDRRIEVIANGLPLWGGVQLAVDTTLVSALDARGRPRRHQRSTVGAALRIARSNKERTYPELMRAPRCRLVVLALEVAGRWSAEAVQFVRLLSRCRARSAPPHLRPSSTAAWVQRWSGLLAFAAARSFAASLLSLPLHGTANVDGPLPDLSDVLAEHRLDSPPRASRLPAR